MVDAASRRAFQRATQSLLNTERADGALKAGSLIVTVFGDAVAPRGGVVALASLITVGSVFGITERHVRTAVGRLAQEGWLAAERIGRSSFYRLTSAGRTRFAAATQRIYGAPPVTWDGDWTLLALVPSSSARRERVRAEMSLHGFGQIQSGLLVHPTWGAKDAAAQLDALGFGSDVVVMRARSIAGVPDTHLARTAWNLGELEKRYMRFLDRFHPVTEAAARSPSLPGDRAFVVRILLIHEYRRIHLRDPLLPSSMLPPDWAGRLAHEAVRTLYARVFQTSERYLAETLQRPEGALPAPSPDTFERFGGLSFR